jgi:tetratricopeptide (TPR) repeat protein
LVALGLTAGVARAEEPPAPAPGPTLPAPYFRAEDLSMRAATKLPEGWALADAGNPTAEKLGTTVRETLIAAKVPEEAIAWRISPVRGPENAEAAVATLDTDPLKTPGGPAPVATLLEAAATAGGWLVRPVGGPTCVVIVAAPPECREALGKAAMAWGAEALRARAQRLAQGGDVPVALATIELALTLEPKSVSAHLFAGEVRSQLAFEKEPFGSPEKALAHAEAALKEYPLYPLPDAARFRAKSLKAISLLVVGKLEASHALYKEMVNDPATVAEVRWGLRYNLACAAAKLGKLDEAFQELGAVLAQDAQETVRGIDHWRVDPDFENLRADARWKALLEKYGAE